MSQDEAAKAFQVRIKAEHRNPSVLLSEAVAVKNGPRAYKSATILTIGDPETGEVKKREFVVQTYSRSLSGPGYDFHKAENRWSCEDDEIQIVQELLNGSFPDSGMYQLARQETGVQEFIAHIDAGRVDPEAVHRVVAAICNSPGLADALARMDDAGLLASIIERNRQRAGLERWRRVVEDPDSTEPDIQKVLNEEWWVFGGRYIKPTIRRQLVIGDQLDLALARADGSLHVIEIKQANVPKLIVPHRSHYRVGDEVHEAVSQAANYLRSLDEHRAGILADLKVDPRRASATVVIGHPKFVNANIPLDVVAETIRTYNSHLSRIEVMTFADLIEGAERSFALAEAGSDDSIIDCEEKGTTGRDSWMEAEVDPWGEPPF
jgi:hypothetical protein